LRRKIKEKIPFGFVSIDSDSKISTITEKPDYECIVNAGIYMLEPHIIDLIPKKYFLRYGVAIKAALRSGSKVAAFPIYEYWRDIGRHQEMQAASNELKAMGGFVKTTGK
jgi:NDP-sugar pyrophosphorylase family protein